MTGCQFVLTYPDGSFDYYPTREAALAAAPTWWGVPLKWTELSDGNLYASDLPVDADMFSICELEYYD